MKRHDQLIADLISPTPFSFRKNQTQLAGGSVQNKLRLAYNLQQTSCFKLCSVSKQKKWTLLETDLDFND